MAAAVGVRTIYMSISCGVAAAQMGAEVLLGHMAEGHQTGPRHE